MYSFLRGLLFLLPAEVAHHMGLFVLGLLEGSLALCRFLRRRNARAELDLTVQLPGLKLANPIGLAAGLDKDAEAVPGLFALGFGFLEVGTLTPRAQPGNPPPRLFRLPEFRALINRMGFNNHGAAAAATRLSELTWRPAPIGANLGKNKETPLERATDDYLAALEVLAPHADYLVVNASSPNTPGLRALQDPSALRELLQALRQRLQVLTPDKPLFLKIAPDLDAAGVAAVVDVALETGLSGLIATNTTVERPFAHPLAGEAGGLSGAPLRARSTAIIREIYRHSRGRLPIIGVGGIFSAEDAYEKLRAGASAVQIYSGLVYEGPGLVRRLLRGLVELLRRDGFATLSAAVGVDAMAATPEDEPASAKQTVR